MNNLLEFLRAYRRNIIIGVLVGLLLYLFLLPGLWPDPRVTVEVPPTARLGSDLPITVRIHAVHGNVQVALVRFYVDYYAASAVAPGHTLYPFPIHYEKPRGAWNHWQINRITWPRTRTLTCTVPIKRLTAAGMLRPGDLNGKIDVELRFVHPISSKRGGHPREYPAVIRQYSTPFTIHIEQ